jgi:hypothetical protein
MLSSLNSFFSRSPSPRETTRLDSRLYPDAGGAHCLRPVSRVWQAWRVCLGVVVFMVLGLSLSACERVKRQHHYAFAFPPFQAYRKHAVDASLMASLGYSAHIWHYLK